jgi:hypothetical protein
MVLFHGSQTSLSKKYHSILQYHGFISKLQKYFASEHPLIIFLFLAFSSLQRGAIDEKIKKKEEMEQFEVNFCCISIAY